jgi:hypothetical protein
MVAAPRVDLSRFHFEFSFNAIFWMSHCAIVAAIPYLYRKAESANETPHRAWKSFFERHGESPSLRKRG